MDLTAGLSSLQFDIGVGSKHQSLITLVEKSFLLLLNSCANCIFFCRLLFSVRQKEGETTNRLPAHRIHLALCESLHVGIIGGGNLGKQLAHCLIDHTELKTQDIRVSTRRPDTLRELQELGVHCTFDNAGLATWAHILILCCLPSQLPNICQQVRKHLKKTSIVYSLVSGVPLPRLKQMLTHSNIVKPDYKWKAGEGEWVSSKKISIAAALKDVTFIESTIPGNTLNGGIEMASNFLVTSMYAAINLCSSQGLSHKQSVAVLNFIIQQNSHSIHLSTKSFVSQEFISSLSEESPFPWFDLCAVQMKETPFSEYLKMSSWLQKRFEELYRTTFGFPLKQP
ncbi:hypothetical protein GDO86_015887 [Hymenochirus boettgeri]|uniref:NADP-dependent oxidoreductase domain-containing protein 1 n=1 Tax=Hymenochirus boettgeri TaxID=247094 RepID=A0A8T2JX97_9PIPI|nr:hypothetical protein GDO86_015887 [Hymenochirus boettgeri]